MDYLQGYISIPQSTCGHQKYLQYLHAFHHGLLYERTQHPNASLKLLMKKLDTFKVNNKDTRTLSCIKFKLRTRF